MDPDFWHARWESQQLGFHEGEVNAMLAAHFGVLGLDQGARVFVPLCGKTRDIAWLLSRGMRVVGVELSDIAVRQLFEGLEVEPNVTGQGPLRHYAADGVDVFAGDIFDLTPEMAGDIDATFDRAALVALPEDMRRRYARQIIAVSRTAQQLLVTFEYDESLMQGPPFSIRPAEVKAHYGDVYDLHAVSERDVPGGLKGFCPAREHTWLLSPKAPQDQVETRPDFEML